MEADMIKPWNVKEHRKTNNIYQFNNIIALIFQEINKPNPLSLAQGGTYYKI